MTNAARFTGRLPCFTLPSWSTKIRSDALIWVKLMPNGLTQNQSGCSGSRTVMCPATPSEKPKRPNSRKPAASCSLRYCRSSSTESKVGGTGSWAFSGIGPIADASAATI